MVKAHNFRELNIWKESMNLTVDIYQFSELIPNSEVYGLISQINRCAVSIPSNIAEGSGRSSDIEFIRFLKIALSSSYELETQLILAHRLYNIEIECHLKTLKNIQAQIGGFIRNLKNSQS